MTTQAVIEWAQSQILTACQKVQRAPFYPDDVRLAAITSIAWADNIRYITRIGNIKETDFDLKIQVMVPRTDLKQVMEFLADVPKTVADVFRDDRLFGGNAITYNADISAVFVNGDVNGVGCIGYTITVPNVILFE